MEKFGTNLGVKQFNQELKTNIMELIYIAKVLKNLSNNRMVGKTLHHAPSPTLKKSIDFTLSTQLPHSCKAESLSCFNRFIISEQSFPSLTRSHSTPPPPPNPRPHFHHQRPPQQSPRHSSHRPLPFKFGAQSLQFFAKSQHLSC